MEDTSMHTGHRARLKAPFLQSGLDALTDIQVLELLLFYVRPRQDTNELAHRLIDYFGSIDRVFDARLGDLERVEGVGRETAAFLHLIPQVSRRYMERKWRPGELMDSAGAAGRLMLLGNGRSVLLMPLHLGPAVQGTVTLGDTDAEQGREQTAGGVCWLRRNGTLPLEVVVVDAGMDEATRSVSAELERQGVVQLRSEE